MAEKINDEIFWLGVNSPDSRHFHGIPSPRGGSYNSYLILDGQPTIIDGTNKPFFDGYVESLKSVIDPLKVAYIVVNHAENDHAGAMKEITELCRNAKVVCTEKGKEFLETAFGVKAEFHIVKENDELSIGKRKMRFIMDPMVHWPETMITYLVEDKIVFTADLFSTEIGHEHLFADEYEPFEDNTLDYFSLIFRPYHTSVRRAVDSVKKLELSMIAPSHGPVYRKGMDKIIAYYDKLLDHPEDNKVLIVYYSIWSSTQKMAQKVAEGVQAEGFEAKVVDIYGAEMVDLMSQALTSKAIALGSLNMINHYYPLFDALFKFLEMNSQKGKKAAVFGSHGWAPLSAHKLKAGLEAIGYNVVGDVDLLFGMRSPEDEAKLVELGKSLVRAVK